MAKIIDVGIPNADKDYIIKTSVYMILIIVCGFALAVFCQYCAAVSSQGTGTRIRNALVEKISSLSYAELEKLGTETLINRITSDVNYVQQAIAFTVRLVSRAPFLCIGALIMSLMIDVTLTLIFLIIIPVLSFILYIFLKATSPLYVKAQKKLDHTALIVRENLNGVRTVRAFSRAEKERKRFKDTAEELQKINIKAANISALMNPVTSAIINLGVIALLYFGASRVFDGHLTRGNILTLSTYASKILYALIIVANLVVMFTKAMISSERINEVLSTEASVIYPLNTLNSVIADPAYIFEFSKVTFSYNKENVLIDINLKLKKGEVLGIIGVTGSGKTTMINLLQRFYDVSSGEILINGKNIKDYSKNDLRRVIGIVPQNNVLFSGSISDNMKWGKQDASDEEIINALKISQAYDFVHALPQGINSMIEEGGKNFSGGQRQRLAIARAIVKSPKILILDDSLSALDYKTDMLLRKSLKQDLPAKSSVVIISQRISSIINAETIIVLQDGKICGIGDHESLLLECAHYNELYSSQFENGGSNEQ